YNCKGRTRWRRGHTMKGKFKTPIVCRVSAISVFLILILSSGSAWAQVTISPGDIVVSDGNAFGGAGGVIRVDPSGGQTEVTSHGFLQEPAAIVIESAGTILVTDRVLPGVIRVDPRQPSDSNQTIVHSGPPFVDPFG